MKKEKVQQLKHGLCQVHWKEGGMSLAAVGSFRDGGRWLAPINWITEEGKPLAYDMRKAWKAVDKVVLIATN